MTAPTDRMVLLTREQTEHLLALAQPPVTGARTDPTWDAAWFALVAALYGLSS